MSVKSLFQSAGFNDEQSQGLGEHLYKSGALREEFLKPLMQHIDKADQEKGTVSQTKNENLGNIKQILLAGKISKAAKQSVGEDGTFDLETFSEKTKGYISDRMSLALLQAAHQRHFLPEVVVSEQNPTKYSQDNQDSILQLAETTGMTQEERVNPDGGASEKIDKGVAIGATVKTMQDYLTRQKRIHENSSNPEYDSKSYDLSLLIGSRKLAQEGKEPLASDNPKQSNDEFKYADKDKNGNQRNYLEYLSEKTGKERGQLTEGDAMKERFEQVFGKSAAKAQEEGWLKPIEAKTAQDFIEKVVASIPDDGQQRTVAMTTVQPFNRTYESNIETALANAGKENVTVRTDGGVGNAVGQAQTIMKEFAKMINGRYEQMARENGVKDPVDQSILGGKQMKEIESQISASRAA